MKTTDPTERVKIALAASARDALGIARNSTGMKWYWEQQCLCGDLFKERVMYMALMQKFSIEEPQLRTLLLSTGTCQLVKKKKGFQVLRESRVFGLISDAVLPFPKRCLLDRGLTRGSLLGLW